MVRSSAVVLLFACAGLLFAQNADDVLAVSVREGEIRSAPGFLSSIESRVAYGETVRVITRRGAWIRVKVEPTRIEGWIHQSSVLPPGQMNLTGGSARESNATSREIALAGRGFNEQIEQEYRDQHELDFEPVDMVETYLVPLSELAGFLGDIGAKVPDGGER